MRSDKGREARASEVFANSPRSCEMQGTGLAETIPVYPFYCAYIFFL